MNCCRETVEMAVPLGNRPAVPRDWIRGVLAQYVAGSACPEPVEGTPEDARKDDHIRGRNRQLVKFRATTLMKNSILCKKKQTYICADGLFTNLFPFYLSSL
jgi:hypothetical protein